MGAHLLWASAVYKYMLLFSACKKDLTHVQYIIFVIMLFYSWIDEQFIVPLCKTFLCILYNIFLRFGKQCVAFLVRILCIWSFASERTIISLWLILNHKVIIVETGFKNQRQLLRILKYPCQRKLLFRNMLLGKFPLYMHKYLKDWSVS